MTAARRNNHRLAHYGGRRQFLAPHGALRVILSRELSLDKIAEIRQQCSEMEVKVPVHGALCIACSGRCLLAAAIDQRRKRYILIPHEPVPHLRATQPPLPAPGTVACGRTLYCAGQGPRPPFPRSVSRTSRFSACRATSAALAHPPDHRTAPVHTGPWAIRL